VALGLLRRGHRPIVYSPHLGASAREIYERGVGIVENLNQVGEPPDIIHAQHYIQTGECVFHFPDAPIVQMCHAWDYWHERPAKFPNVRRYVAVDETVRDRLVHVEGIEPSRVEILLNGVDLARLPPRPTSLPQTPSKALAFTKSRAEIPFVEHACRSHGIKLDVLGQGGDRVVAHPEAELVKYDLVFASARMALEAAAAGSAVVICDSRGLAGMLRMENLEQLRRLNFGLRCLVHPVTVDGLKREIGRYDPDDAARVAEKLKESASIEQTLDGLERIYTEVLSEAQSAPVRADAARRAQLAFLEDALPRRRQGTRWPWMLERQQLTARIETLEKELAATRAALLSSSSGERGS
jgi:hypothetical protein